MNLRHRGEMCLVKDAEKNYRIHPLFKVKNMIGYSPR